MVEETFGGSQHSQTENGKLFQMALVYKKRIRFRDCFFCHSQVPLFFGESQTWEAVQVLLNVKPVK